MPRPAPTYLPELTSFVEQNLDKPLAVVGSLAALLSDPDVYEPPRGQPAPALTRFAEELVISDRTLQRYLADTATPVRRELIRGTWTPVWQDARASAKQPTSFEYDVCISFAGSDRAIARAIADAIQALPLKRRVFYDEFEKVTLWGNELFAYLHHVYSQKCMYCLVLFSNRYRERAWTQHELRAAQTRVLQERRSYLLPIAIDQGAVPEEFESLGYWPFVAGDEQRLAEAVEDKINEFAQQHYMPIDEFAGILSRSRLASALVDGFRAAIKQRQADGAQRQAQALMAVALIVAADTEHLLPSVRALLNLVVFGAGCVGDMFGDDDRLTVVAGAQVMRWIGSEGPLMFAFETWSDHLRPYEERWKALDAEHAQEDAEDAQDDAKDARD